MELYPKETIARPGRLVIRELAHESLASLRSSYERERVDVGTLHALGIVCIIG